MRKLFSLLMLGLYLSAPAQDALVESWLVAGAIPVIEPALGSSKNVKGKTFRTSELLKQPLLDFSTLYPQVGVELPGTALRWREQKIDGDSSLYLNFSRDGYSVALVSTYVELENYWKGNVGIESTLPFEAFIGETKVTDRYSANAEGAVVTRELKLLPGKHRVLVKLLVSDTLTGPSRLKAFFKPSGDFLPDAIIPTTNHIQTKTLKHLLQGPKLSGANISASGDMVLITISEVNTQNDRTSHHRSVIRLSDSKVVTSFRQSEVTQLQWMPKGNKLSYVSSGDVWIYDLDKGNEYMALKGLNDISGYRWSPNEDYIIYYVNESDDSRKGDLRRILNMEDRQPNWRDRRFLFIGHLESGIHERLTWGNRSTWLQDISPDGKTILFSLSWEDYTKRPYRRNSLLSYNLNTHQLDTLWSDKLFGTSVSYSPDATKLLVTGSPLTFGDDGVNVSEGMIPNGYDTQAFIYNLQTKQVNAFTRNFNPSIRSAHWCAQTGNIYLNTTDQDWNTLYEYNVRRDSFTALKLEQEMINSISFAREKQVAVYTGSGMNSWPKAYSYDLRRGRSKLINNTDAQNYTNVQLGHTSEWNFTSSHGQKVTGRYYLPPNFDANKKYPAIVYYYGGTTPVGRDFGGRYPKQHYAANGFIVLVLQPSGAIGFGQEFSAEHVNAWGEITADQIIEGTQKFAQEHSFVDKDRIGCIGASYGGFMTKYLLTQTDIFAAAISHAGISSISSYWGEGYWGYSYSAEASAYSFPWNNMELYIDRSPLFSADKVTTPLLLLHGTDDTNVPVGESIQMFTALRLLGKPVELIQIDGADHHIHKYSQRIEWTNTILAYFAKYLKDEDGWWKEMYPDGNYW